MAWYPPDRTETAEWSMEAGPTWTRAGSTWTRAGPTWTKVGPTWIRAGSSSTDHEPWLALCPVSAKMSEDENSLRYTTTLPCPENLMCYTAARPCPRPTAVVRPMLRVTQIG